MTVIFYDKYSHLNLYRHNIQGDVPQSIDKANHQSPSPIYFYKLSNSSLMPLLAMNMPMFLF